MTQIIEIGRVEARLVAHDWPWATRNRARIAANWERRRSVTPAIFNGPILMLAELERRGDTMLSRHFRTDYMHLVGTLDLGDPDNAAENGFAMGALRTRDGAFVLGEMAADTANSGRLYFPAGTPDPSDLTPDGRVDLEGSILREIAEETGLGSDLCRLGAGWTIIRRDARTAFMREVALDLDAAEAVARIEAHLAAEARPELAGIRLVRDPSDLDPDRMPGFLLDYLGRVMGGAATGAAGPHG